MYQIVYTFYDQVQVSYEEVACPTFISVSLSLSEVPHEMAHV